MLAMLVERSTREVEHCEPIAVGHDAGQIPSRHDAKAVVLDFVDPTESEGGAFAGDGRHGSIIPGMRLKRFVVADLGAQRAALLFSITIYGFRQGRLFHSGLSGHGRTKQ
jgi:hypothetical protein